MTETHGQTVCEQLAKPDHIIVATDLDDVDTLMPYATAQAKAYDAQLTFIHVLKGDESPDLFVGGISRMERAAQKKMSGLLARAKAEGVICAGEITQNVSPENALSQAARRFRAERMIMATHGRGRLGQIMLGSIARELLTFLDIPIFAVGPNVDAKASRRSPERIIHPVSFSHEYKRSVEFAIKLAKAHQSELLLMHVQDPDVIENVDSMRLVQLADEARSESGIDLRVQTAYGNVVQEVLNTAKVFGADWLVLGTTPIAAAPMSYTPLRANNMAYRLMAAAEIPVLTFPRRAQTGGHRSTEQEFAAIVQ